MSWGGSAQPVGEVGFISLSQTTQGYGTVIEFIGLNVETQVPGNIQFFGASVEKVDDAVMWYEVN